MSNVLKGYDNYYWKDIETEILKAITNTPRTITVDTADLGAEEWVWVTGYKGTDKNMQCRGYQFELGKQFDIPEDEKIVICSSGFHLCKDLKNVFNYYNIGNGNRFFEVKALVRRYNKNGYYTFEHRGDKMTSKSIEFVRELTADEVFEQSHMASCQHWTAEQKELAMKTSPDDVKLVIDAATLVDLGYSEAFAKFVCKKGRYDLACTMATMPNVNMDVKVLTIAMDIYE
jgi:hypothetical protein